MNDTHTSQAAELGESVYAEWDKDGDLYLFTSDVDFAGEPPMPDDCSAEIWMNAETRESLRRFLDAKMQRGAHANAHGKQILVGTKDLMKMLNLSRTDIEAKGSQEALNEIRDTLRFILHDSGVLVDQDIEANK